MKFSFASWIIPASLPLLLSLPALLQAQNESNGNATQVTAEDPTAAPVAADPTSAPTYEGCCTWTFNTCVDDTEFCAGTLGCEACNGWWLETRPTDATCVSIYSDCNGVLVDSCCKGLICVVNPDNGWSSCEPPIEDTPSPTLPYPTTPPTPAPSVAPSYGAPPSLSIEDLPYSEVELILRSLNTRDQLDVHLFNSSRFTSSGLMTALRIMFEYGIGDEDDQDGYFFYLGKAKKISDTDDEVRPGRQEDSEEDDPYALEYRYGLANLAMFLSQLMSLDNFKASNICSTSNATMDETSGGNTTTAISRATSGRSSPCGAIGVTPLCDPEANFCDLEVYPIAFDSVCACVLGQLNTKLGMTASEFDTEPRWAYYGDDVDFCKMPKRVLCNHTSEFDEGPFLVPMSSWILNVQRYESESTGWNYIDELRKLVDSEMDEELQRILLLRVATIVTQGTHVIPFDPELRDPSEDSFDLVVSLFQKILPSVFDKPVEKKSGAPTISSTTNLLLSVAVGWGIWCMFG